jgi:hypothetical protein
MIVEPMLCGDGFVSVGVGFVSFVMVSFGDGFVSFVMVSLRLVVVSLRL